jgi:hypothetical protein
MKTPFAPRIVGSDGISAAAPDARPVLADLRDLGAPETIADRIKRLQAEARALAKDHVQGLIAAINGSASIAAEIAAGGDAYNPGIRDLCRRFAEDAEAKVQTLEAISARS